MRKPDRYKPIFVRRFAKCSSSARSGPQVGQICLIFMRIHDLAFVQGIYLTQFALLVQFAE